MILPFDVAVPPNGYAWWYMDGLSADGRHGITIIAFLGCIFSPWYRAARRAGPADPLDHAVINVCLYGPSWRRWVITGWPRHEVERDATQLRIGRSRLELAPDQLRVDFDDRASPFRQRVRGSLRIWPTVRREEVVTLEAAGRHLWYPMAPCGRFEAVVEGGPSFAGSAYQDANSGDEPLEDALHAWTWVRQPRPDGSTAVLYDVMRTREPELRISRIFHPNGGFEALEADPVQPLPRGWWGVRRHTRGDGARFAEAFEDGPFYTRSLLETSLGGHQGPAMHEWADLDLFVKPWVQFLLPFKMRRMR